MRLGVSRDPVDPRLNLDVEATSERPRCYFPMCYRRKLVISPCRDKLTRSDDVARVAPQ